MVCCETVFNEECADGCAFYAECAASLAEMGDYHSENPYFGPEDEDEDGFCDGTGVWG